MTIFNPLLDLSALNARLRQDPGLVIVCYCAQWCDTCEQYRPLFQGLSDKWPQHAFVWVDIEDSPDFLGDEDVENFPTVSIQNQNKTLFFGTLLPYISHLDRLIEHADSLSVPITKAPPLLSGLPGVR